MSFSKHNGRLGDSLENGGARTVSLQEVFKSEIQDPVSSMAGIRILGMPLWMGRLALGLRQMVY